MGKREEYFTAVWKNCGTALKEGKKRKLRGKRKTLKPGKLKGRKRPWIMRKILKTY